MAALDLAMQKSKMRRLEETMRRAEGAEVKGDFAGSVAGKWQRLDTPSWGRRRRKGEYRSFHRIHLFPGELRLNLLRQRPVLRKI